MGGWGPGGRYFNPPMVLVVEGLAELEAVRVVQLYDDPIWAGPGDLPVDPEDPSLYAETWNGYAVRWSDLGRRYGAVPAASLEAVRCAIEVASVAGEVIEERSAVAAYMEAFRRLEVEVSAFFAVRVLDAAWS